MLFLGSSTVSLSRAKDWIQQTEVLKKTVGLGQNSCKNANMIEAADYLIFFS